MSNLVLLTGFLGAGKTTLMEQILNAYSDKKVGVIINEFGNVNIDATLIRRNGIEMAELSNGSIFCACIKDKFVDSLIELSGHDLDYVFIEASGLADPANMPQILQGIVAKTVEPYHYRGAICVLDGESFLDLYELLPAIHHQMCYSQGIIINKADLMAPKTLEEIQVKIQEINPHAKRYVTSYCKVDIKEIIDHLGMVLSKGKDTTNTAETRPNTFIVRGETQLSMESLKGFIQDIVG
ncbi:MAG: GTP-binding protein, partial [Anaerovorax sp.]